MESAITSASFALFSPHFYRLNSLRSSCQLKCLFCISPASSFRFYGVFLLFQSSSPFSLTPPPQPAWDAVLLQMTAVGRVKLRRGGPTCTRLAFGFFFSPKIRVGPAAILTMVCLDRKGTSGSAQVSGTICKIWNFKLKFAGTVCFSKFPENFSV